jgi:SAM-dependent methyltransferase
MSPEVRCPLCGGPSRRGFERHGFWIRDCADCGHRFAEGAVAEGHVERVYGDAYFRDGGAGYPDYRGEEPILRDRGRWYARMLDRHVRPGSVLEVGCAAGFWLAELVAHGWTGWGIEPNAAMAAHARARLGLDVRTGTLEELRTEERFDLVALIQVLAHFADPRRSLQIAAGLLRPGGHVLVETWDRESRTARWSGRRWHEYSPPSVLHWFSPARLRDLGERLGLREVARGRPRKRIGARHAKSLLRHTLAGSAAGRLVARGAGIIPDHLTLPYPGDDLFWMLLEADGGPSRRVNVPSLYTNSLR